MWQRFPDLIPEQFKLKAPIVNFKNNAKVPKIPQKLVCLLTLFCLLCLVLFCLYKYMNSFVHDPEYIIKESIKYIKSEGYPIEVC